MINTRAAWVMMLVLLILPGGCTEEDLVTKQMRAHNLAYAAQVKLAALHPTVGFEGPRTPQPADFVLTDDLVNVPTGTQADLATACKQIQEDLEEALKLAPNLVECHYYLGITAILIRDNHAAIQHLETAIDQEPTQGMAYLILGDLYVMSNDFSKARSLLESQIRNEPASLKEYGFMWTSILVSMEDYEGMIPLGDALIRQQKQAEGLVSKGAGELFMGNTAAGEALLSQAIAIAPAMEPVVADIREKAREAGATQGDKKTMP